MYDNIRALFKRLAPAVDFCSLRLVDETSEHIMVRQDILQPISHRSDRGAMLTVIHRGGYGYAATSDLSENGLKEALRRAKDWAEASAGRSWAPNLSRADGEGQQRREFSPVARSVTAAP